MIIDDIMEAGSEITTKFERSEICKPITSLSGLGTKICLSLRRLVCSSNMASSSDNARVKVSFSFYYDCIFFLTRVFK